MKFLNRFVIAVALAAAALAAAPARAAVVGSIPGGGRNEFLGAFLGGTPVEGWYGANLYLTGPATISVQYFGAEAGFTNQFNFGPCSFTHNGGTTFSGSSALGAGDAIGTCSAGAQPAGLLNFNFLINGGSPGPANVTNSNDLTSPLPNFFVAFDSNNYLLDMNVNGSTAGSGASVFLFLDDGGGGDDDNHDDMVIRLSIQGGSIRTAVPEPTSLALVSLALFGLAYSRRNRI